MNSLSIDFYDENEASVRVDWSDNTLQTKNSEANRWACALLFACHAIRIFRTKDTFSDALAHYVKSDWKPILNEVGEKIQAIGSHVIHTPGNIPSNIYSEDQEKYWSLIMNPIFLIPYLDFIHSR